jgi:hypothetical protein
MKKLFIFAVVLSTTCATQVYSQQVTVQAGEHEDFTRFVFRLPPSSTWSVDNSVGQTRISIDNFTGGFNLSEVFRIIPRTRVSSVEAEEDTLILNLTCRCAVEAFVTSGNFLAIDVQNGPFLSAEEIDQLRNLTRSANLPKSEFLLGDLLWRGDAQVASTPKSEEDVSITPETELLNEVRPLQEARDELVRGVAAAATRGILTANSREVDQTKADQVEVIDPEQNTESEHQAGLRQPVSNIRISNSGELLKTELNATTSINELTKCSRKMNLNISEWKPKGTFEQEMSLLQAELYDATDKLNPQTALNLTRLYLYYGLGPEAARVLALSKEVQQSHPELVDISSIMEFGYARNPRIVHKLSECGGVSHFWALLSADEVPENSGINTDLVLSSLNSLPLHLRRYFVPIVSDRLLATGDVRGSMAAIRMLNRTTVNDLDELTLAQVALNLAIEEDVDSTALTEIVSDSSPVAPRALISYINAKVQTKEPVSDEIVKLLESYVFEFQGSEDHFDLNMAYAVALAKSSKFEESFNNLFSLSSKDDGNTLFEQGLFRNVIITELVRNAPDIQFVSIFFKYSTLFEKLDDQSTITAVAGRLLDLGFKMEAESVIGLISGEDENDRSSLLKAEIAFANGFPREALELISDMSGSEADDLRTSIYNLQDAFDLAQTEEQNVSIQLGDRMNSGLLSNATNATPMLNEELDSLSKITLEEVPAVEKSPEFLEELEALILNVQTARQALRGSLSYASEVN